MRYHVKSFSTDSCINKTLLPFFQMILRILPFVETSSANSPDVDQAQYEKISGIPPVMVAYAFDKYRSLKQDLETVGIFTKEKECVKAANDFNERSSKLYAAGSTPVMAIVLDCEFPRTYTRSSLGLSLTDQQLAERIALLNHWMGHLMKSFYKFSPTAQTQIIDFLGLTIRDPHVNDIDDTSQLDLQDQVIVSKIFLSM